MNGMQVVFGVLLLGDNLVPLVFGTDYRPVTANLVPLTVALVIAALSSTASLLALVYERPAVALAASGVRLAAFWALGLPLILLQGSRGGCLTVLAASAVYSGYYTWRMRDVMCHMLRSWAVVVGLGMPFLMLVWLRSSWLVNLALYGAFIAGYGGLLFLLRVVTPGEIVRLWQALASREQVPDANGKAGT